VLAGDGAITPSWAGAAHIQKIIMIGVPNEGSADAFATLIDGYSITEGLRRRVPLLNKLTAEDAIASPSVFQLLPHSNATKFLDEKLSPLQVDLFDAATWRKYEWSPLTNPEFRKRYAAHRGTNSPPSEEDKLKSLDAYLEAILQRARRFHEALDAIDGNPPVRLLAIGGDCEETLNSPVVLHDLKNNRWTTLIRPREYRTSSGEKIGTKKLTTMMYAPGDGRVTRSSLLGETLNQNGSGSTSTLRLAYAVFACDLHGQLQRNKTLQDNALTAIVAEVMQ
jgi:hypothetical protein